MGFDGEGSSSNRASISRDEVIAKCRGEGSGGTFAAAASGAEKSAAGALRHGSAAKETRGEYEAMKRTSIKKETTNNKWKY